MMIIVSDPLLTPTNPPPHFFPFTNPDPSTNPLQPLGQPLPLPHHMQDDSKPLPLEPGAAFPPGNMFHDEYEREGGGLGLGLGGMDRAGAPGGHMRGLSRNSEVDPEYTPR